MALMHEFEREEKFPSWFANRIQDYVSAACLDLRIERKDATTIRVVPQEPPGLAAVCIQGRWRFNSTTIERAVPGNATYKIWAVGLDNDIVNTPEPFTDETVYAWDLRMTTGAAPSGTGVEIYEEIGEVTASGGAITALKQTAFSIPGSRIADGAISGTGVTATRQPNGGLLLTLDDGSVGTNKLANDAVTAAKIADNAVGSSEIANDAVGSSEIATGAVGADEIADGSVGTNELASLAVTSGKLNDGAVINGKLGTIAVTRTKVALNHYEATGYVASGGDSLVAVSQADVAPGLYLAMVNIEGRPQGAKSGFELNGGAGTIYQSSVVSSGTNGIFTDFAVILVTGAGTTVRYRAGVPNDSDHEMLLFGVLG